MKTSHWPERISISEAALATRKNRATIARAVRDLPFIDGPGGAKLYESWRVLQAVYIGEGGPSYSEAHRLLTIARTRLVEKEIEHQDETTIPVDDHVRAFQFFMSIFRSFCLEREGKILLRKDIDDAHRSIVDFLIWNLPEKQQPAARRAFEKQQLDAIAGEIQWIRDRVERDEHAVERDRLNEIVQMAYATARANPTRATLDALEAAQDACYEHDKKSSVHKYDLQHNPGYLAGYAESRKKSQAELWAKLLGGGQNGE